MTKLAARYSVLLPFLLMAAFLQAQTGNGRILGTIKDASGAVVPGAQVSITHKATAQTERTKSNDVGSYLFPSAATGAYEILVEALGMQGWKAELTLFAGQTVEVNAALQVGSTSQTLTVAGDVAPLVTTTSGTLGNVLERERVDQLPLNGRNFQSLVGMTTPGIENAGAIAGFVWGLRYATEFQQDGALLGNRYTGAITASPPGLDGINEIQAETNSASAKVSRPGLVTVTTRSGSNKIHGSLFETARNNGLGLARARTDFYDKPPQLVRNEFGGSFGGPIWIPKIYNGRNRTFFFFNYEGRRIAEGATTEIAVPTAAMVQGNFAGLTNAAGQTLTIYDPFTSTPTGSRTPFPNNQIPITRESPVAKYLFSVTPLPTLPGVNPLVANNWYGPGPDKTDRYTYTLRFDHQ
ncbi:MAG: carboxypeptidase-like regulatory domain-containing protein, partial [Kiritimatiellota bacterium]|nr:carboxypeptidase-like regulatory domain-containing protein [Kiritimatiellota bacterium]